MFSCPNCRHESNKVVDSRAGPPALGVPSVRRRRRCESCKYRFTTYEVSAHIIENTVRPSEALFYETLADALQTAHTMVVEQKEKMYHAKLILKG